MASDLYIFFNDRLSDGNPTPVLTASDTVNGYAIDNVRRADLSTAWKGGDSTTVDKYLQVDGGSTGWLGSTGQDAYICIAYDARGSDQDSVGLLEDTGDAPGGAFATVRSVITLNKTGINCAFDTFPISNPARQYYRLNQSGAARTESTGSITAKILCWSMFNADGVFRLPIDYPGESEAPYSIRTQFKYGQDQTAGGVRVFSKYAAPGQSFNISFQPASLTVWERLRDSLIAYGSGARAFFVQKDGLINTAQSNFFLCRLTNMEIVASVQYKGNYLIDMDWETEPWI